MLGHKSGDVVELNRDEGEGIFEIISISPAPIDELDAEKTADASTDRQDADAVSV